MDNMSILFIGLICFTVIAFVCVLLYIFQPKYAKEKKTFSKKNKTIITPESTIVEESSLQTTKTEIQQSLPTIDSLSLKPLFKNYELTSFSKMYRAFRNKDVFILSKILFSEFVSIQKISATQNNEFYSILPYLKADFLICDTTTGNPICIVKDKKIPTESSYKIHMQKISEKLKIKYIEVNGIDDISIAQIFQIMQNN